MVQANYPAMPEAKPTPPITRADYTNNEVCNGCGGLGDRRINMVVWYLAKYSSRNIVAHYVHNVDFCKNKVKWICGVLFTKGN